MPSRKILSHLYQLEEDYQVEDTDKHQEGSRNSSAHDASDGVQLRTVILNLQ